MAGLFTNRRNRYNRRTRRDAPAVHPQGKASWQFGLLAAFLTLVFLIGGGSRGDIAALIVLRPISILVAMTGAMGLTKQHLLAYRWLFMIALACIGVVAIQLVPLPPRIFYALPGRSLIREVDALAGTVGIWRPMSLKPSATWNALWALTTPLATLLLVVQLEHWERRRLLGVFLLIGLASGLLGLLQITGDPHGPLYPYEITHNGIAVGLFANRNHQAVFLVTLLPMLVVWAGERSESGSVLRWLGLFNRNITAILAAICLIPLILITGSRSGLIAGGIAGCSIPLLMASCAANAQAGRRPRVLRGQSQNQVAISAAAIAGLMALTIWLGRALAWDRLRDTDPTGEIRLRILPTLFHMIRDFLPWGSGFGSFEPVNWIYEPDLLLMPLSMNHAHDDWLEIVVTGGVPAALVALLAVLAWAIRAAGIARAGMAKSSIAMPGLGLVILLLLGVASLSDYPLRVPSLASLMICAAAWASADGRPRAPAFAQHKPTTSHS